MSKAQTISQKIHELFAFRRIPELLRLGGIEPDSPFVERLANLQSAIYALDACLESELKVDPKQLKTCWAEIYSALNWFGLKESKARKYTKQIRKYEAYELDLRKGKLPLSRPMTRLYAWKSCDVKLLRKLIYRHAPLLLKDLPEEDWGCYDLITELNDDIHDVFEDCETINGNRFLISLLVNGKAKTRKQYKRCLNNAGEQARKQFKNRTAESAGHLYRWTRERQRETEELLRITMDDQKLSLVENSRIAIQVLKKKPQVVSS